MDTNKSLLNKIRTLLNMDPIEVVEPIEDQEVKVNLASSTLQDGAIIYYDGEFSIGTIIYTDEVMETLAPDGEYILEDGSVIKIENGSVIEIETPDIKDEEVEEEVEMEEDWKKKYDELLSLVEEMKLKIETIENEKVEMKNQLDKFSSMDPAEDPIISTPQEKRELTEIEKRLNTLNAIRQMRKK